MNSKWSQHLLAAATLTVLAGSAHAGLSDLIGSVVKTKTESRETVLVYDFTAFAGTNKEMLNVVKNALTYHGDDAVLHEGNLSAVAPEVPGKLTFKALFDSPLIPVTIKIPSCAGSSFSVSSRDASMSRYGDSSNYMACGFPYAGGFRVSFYAQYQSTTGGVGGLLSGATLGKAIANTMGFGTDPQGFINASVKKMEEDFAAKGWQFAIIEMAPAIEGKVIVEDPLVARTAAKAIAQAQVQVKADQRVQRLAARADLRKLGFDAADVSQFRKAISTSDEDIVSMFMEAGAIDANSADETGKPLTSYATKPGIRELLAKR